MLGLSVVGDALAVLVAVVGTIVVTSLRRTLVDPTDLSAISEGSHLVAGLVILGLFSAAAGAVTLWTLGPIRRGDPTARPLVTAVQLVDLLAAALALGVAGLGAGQVVVNLVVSVPFTAVMLGLLWFPEGSKLHFGDPVALTRPPTVPASPPPAGSSEPPTVPLRVPTRPGRPMRPFLVTSIAAVGVVAVILVVLGLSMSASGSALEKQAEGSWTCQALGDEAPFDVVIGDGTFSIPSRFLAGTWSLSPSGLTIESTWSKVSSQPRSSVTIGDIPASTTTQGAGSSPATYRTPTYPTPFGRTLNWSYTGGHFQVRGGTSIATTGVDCTKTSNGSSGS
jgi:hypothetical protein